MKINNYAELHRFKSIWSSYSSTDTREKEETYAILPLDLEKVDYINTKVVITQLGIRTMSTAKPGQCSSGFFLIGDNKRYRNRFCTAVDNTNFAFAKPGGANKIVIRHQRDIKFRLDRIVDGLKAKHTKIVIVVWDGTHDMAWLRDGADWVVRDGIQVLDLQAAYMAHRNIHRGQKPSLRTAMESENIPFEEAHFHNAGNDAHYTGEMFSTLGKAV